MAGLDMKKLREQSKTIADRAGGGDGLVVFCSKLKEEQDFRITEPSDAMNGQYYLNQVGWWINGKFYQTNKTFGDNDVIKSEIDAAKESGDEELLALISATKDKKPLLKMEWRALIPGYFLNVKYDDNEDRTSIEVEGDSGKILSAKPQLMDAIHRLVVNKQFQNKTKEGLTHRKTGYNLVIGKRGTGLDTEYYAMGWTEQTEMDDKYYTGDRYPDVIKYVQSCRKSDAYLRSVIRNYLYGDPVLDEKAPEKATPEKAAEVKATPKTTETKAVSGRPSTAATTLTKGAATGRPVTGVKKTGDIAGDKGGRKRSLLDDATAEAGNAAGMDDLD